MRRGIAHRAIAFSSKRHRGFGGFACRLAGGKDVSGFPVDNRIAIGRTAFVVKYKIVSHKLMLLFQRLIAVNERRLEGPVTLQ